MVHNRTTNFRNLAAQFFLGRIALASVTLAFGRLGVELASTAFALIRSARERKKAALQAEAHLRRGGAYLRDSEKRWREFFERNQVMYFMIEATGTVPSVNGFVSSLITLSGTSKEYD